MSNTVQRLLLLLGTGVFCVALWLAAVRPGEKMYDKLVEDEIDAQIELEEFQRKSLRVAEIMAEASGMRERIKSIESTLPEGDSYRWIIARMQRYSKSYDLDILEVTPHR